MEPQRRLHIWQGAVLLGAGMLVTSCAWDAGEPFATLDARLEARLEVPADRDAGGGWQKLASGYEIAIEQLEVEAGELGLIDSGAGAGSFDPANPPPGYSLCHNGHCHADDGGLVDYEDIIAALAQGTGARIVVALPVGEMDLVAGVSRELACLPGCDLPLANITLARLGVTRVRARGLVRDGRAPARIAGEVPWALDLSFPADDPLVFTGPLDLPADRVHEPEISLLVEIAIGSTLFDGVAWDALDATAGTYEPAADADALAALLAALDEVRVAATPTR